MCWFSEQWASPPHTSLSSKTILWLATIPVRGTRLPVLCSHCLASSESQGMTTQRGIKHKEALRKRLSPKSLPHSAVTPSQLFHTAPQPTVAAAEPGTLKIPVTREDDSESGLWLVGVFRQVTRSLVLSEGPFKHTSKSNLSTACPGENCRDLEKTAYSTHRSIAKSQIKGSLGGGQAPASLPLNPFSPLKCLPPKLGSRA